MRVKTLVRMGMASVCVVGAASVAALGASAATQGSAAGTPVGGTAWPDNQAHRDIFCGAPGTETSREYAEALKRRIDELVKNEGGTPAQAIARLRASVCAG